MRAKKMLSSGLACTLAFSMLAATGCGNQSASDEGDTFSWWIYSGDGAGTYYDEYEENPAVQWLNQQYWDVENGTLGTEENGNSLRFTFQTPISGSEIDNFNTMLSTGGYTDIIDMAVSPDTAETLYNEGIAMDITSYVEEYCPNYVEFLDENPEQKALVTYLDDEGKTHYYSMACLIDGNDVPWGGYVYRRDWVVKYCEPTAYVWDWDSDYVKENGHPAVTPLENAVSSGNLEGWKQNTVTEFTSDEGEDPKNDYTDNVIFPSGTSDPLTISDWEWMFEGFQKAIDEKGFSDNSDAYCTTLYYPGFLSTGDLVSSFGGGNGSWYKDADQNVSFSGTSDNFRTYLECMNNWNEKGWLDTKFETRASDIFFSINSNGTAQGMVGLWYSYVSSLGDTIRTTCVDPEDQQDAYVMACSAPINDVYGSDAQKYHDPDCFYQGSRIAGNIVITTAAEDKDLETLFTFFNWMYSREGSLTRSWGLNSEQLNSCEIENNLYAENGLDGAYVLEEGAGEDGKDLIRINYDTSSDLANALKFMRLSVGINMTGAGANLDYTLDRGNTEVVDHAIQQFTRYTSTGSVMDYNSRLSEDENEIYGDLNTQVSDYMSQRVPTLIKEGLDGWDEYVEGLEAMDPEQLTEIYQGIVDDLFGK